MHRSKRAGSVRSMWYARGLPLAASRIDTHNRSAKPQAAIRSGNLIYARCDLLPLAVAPPLRRRRSGLETSRSRTSDHSCISHGEVVTEAIVRLSFPERIANIFCLTPPVRTRYVPPLHRGPSVMGRAFRGVSNASAHARKPGESHRRPASRARLRCRPLVARWRDVDGLGRAQQHSLVHRRPAHGASEVRIAFSRRMFPSPGAAAPGLVSFGGCVTSARHLQQSREAQKCRHCS